MYLIFLSAFAAGLSYSIAPGVINAEAIRRGFTHGFRSSLLFQVGTLAGIIVWAAVTLSSVVVMRPSTGLSLLLGICGALFLIWMGWGAVRDSWRRPVLMALEPSGRADLLSGALLSLANPFTGVFWLSIASSLLSGDALTAPLSAAVTIVSGFILATLIWSVLLATIVSYSRRLVRAAAFRWLNVAAGICMALFGFGLFWQTLAAL
jgi:chemosensory pili system protein ChpE